MKIIPFDKINELNISPMTCYKWVSEAIKLKKDVLLPAKISLKPDIEGVFYNTMPVIIPYDNVGGVKIVTRYPRRKPVLDSEILLYDLENGKNIAFMDGNWITAMRTGTVAAHSVKMFAIDGFKEIGIIGLGNTARAALKVLLAIYPDREIRIKLKMYKNQHNIFAEEFSSFNNVAFTYCDSFEKVIYGSDVIISAVTMFENNICEDRYFKEGVLVVPIHTRGFTNCDLFFDKIFADDTKHVKKFKYFTKYKYFAEVSDVVNGIKMGRENNKERILVYNIGIALHDIYFANKIYGLMKNKCEEISLNAPTKKIWL